VVNTADAMVGYKNEKYQHFGFASAKLDDFFNWVPSRLTAAIMILANATLLKVRLKMCIHIVLRDAKKHPSPNSGFPESAMAALLGVQLGGVNKYKGIISNRAKLGDRIFPLKADHIEQSILIMLRTNLLFVVMLMIGGVIVEAAVSWVQSILFI
jgi:adenosylcobinamide-phosphate synthase